MHVIVLHRTVLDEELASLSFQLLYACTCDASYKRMSAVLFSCECHEIGVYLWPYFHDKTEMACYHEEEHKIVKKIIIESEGDTCVRQQNAVIKQSFGIS